MQDQLAAVPRGIICDVRINNFGIFFDCLAGIAAAGKDIQDFRVRVENELHHDSTVRSREKRHFTRLNLPLDILDIIKAAGEGQSVRNPLLAARPFDLCRRQAAVQTVAPALETDI